ncbi:hypothetical protein ECANGB1_2020 [Enterospora canceri]|uniref:Uncharacterized protein n=1 Tax=Enterospora canceri TaxID=1081671 RepID=A0A1Y1S563_9MICR|nr:hypothetical protein ECANGB1_2020 [Enterospora canceri]
MSPQEVALFSSPKETDKESDGETGNESDHSQVQESTQASVQDSADKSEKSNVPPESGDKPEASRSLWDRIIEMCCCISTVEDESTYTTY